MAELLNRDQILAAKDLSHEDVPVPEWGGTVRIRGMTGDERDAFEISLVHAREDGANLSEAHIRARLVAFTAVDSEGKRLFTEADVAALGAKSSAPLDRCYAVAQRLSRLTAGDLKELKGNSGGDPSADSISG